MRTVIYDPNQPVMIRRFDFEYQAELARALLEAADIPSMLVRDACGGMGTGGVQIAVRRRDVYDALEALEAREEPPDVEAPPS